MRLVFLPPDDLAPDEPVVRLGRRKLRFAAAASDDADGASGVADLRMFTLLFVMAARGCVDRAGTELHGLRGWELSAQSYRKTVTRTVAALKNLLGEKAIVAAPSGFKLGVSVDLAPELENLLSRRVWLTAPPALFGDVPAGATWRACDERPNKPATPPLPLDDELRGAPPHVSQALREAAAWLQAAHNTRKSTAGKIFSSLASILYEAYRCIVRHEAEVPRSSVFATSSVFGTFLSARLRRLFRWSERFETAHPVHLALATFLLGELALYHRYAFEFDESLEVLEILPPELLSALRAGRFGAYGMYAAGRWLDLFVSATGYAGAPDRVAKRLETTDPEPLIAAVLHAGAPYAGEHPGLPLYYALSASVPWYLARGDKASALLAVDKIRDNTRRRGRLPGTDQQYMVYRLFVGGARDPDEKSEDEVYQHYRGDPPRENKLQTAIVRGFFELKRRAERAPARQGQGAPGARDGNEDTSSEPPHEDEDSSAVPRWKDVLKYIRGT